MELINSPELESQMLEHLTCDGVKYSICDDLIQTNDFSFKLTNKSLVSKLAVFQNPLIYGKNTILGIVGLEVEDNNLRLYFSDGNQRDFHYQHWLLTNKKLDYQCKMLEGNQHYRYIRYFDSTSERSKFYGMNKNKADMYVCWNAREAAMLLHGITLYKGLKVSDVGVLAFDIESEGLTHHKDSEVYLITNSYEKNGVRIRKHFRLDEYDYDSGKMITDWAQWVCDTDPDIINGWNIFGYDLPYLNHVAKMRGVSLNLGRNSEAIEFSSKPSKKRVDGNTEWDYYKCHVSGRQIIDGLFIALNYGVGKGYPSWGLKPIAEAEGFVTPDRQFYDASKIAQNWANPVEREKIVQYGIDDSEDTINLYYRMVTSYFYTCQSVAMPFEEMMQGATGKWVNSVLVRSYLQDGRSIPKPNEATRVAGGMSYGIPGIYSNVLKWDASSYYPSTILKFNIHNPQKDPSNHFVSTVKYFTEARLLNKKLFKETGDRHYDDLQAAGKIFINSSYGLLATAGLHFNSFEDAKLITMYCRAGLQKAVIWATGKPVTAWWNEYNEEQDFPDFSFIDKKTEISSDLMPINNWKLVNLDTDSLSFCKNDESEFTEAEIESIQAQINQIMYCNWEDDGYFSRVVVLKAKNYVLLPKGSTKFKLKGSSLTDQKKEPALREFMEAVLDNLVFGKTQLSDIYQKYVTEIMNISDISRWAVKKSITKKLFESTRKNETNVVDALGDKSLYREGDKVYIYNAVDGMRQVITKDVPQFYKKTGLPKMERNSLLKLVSNYSNDFDKLHYLQRLTDTLHIFELVVDTSQFTNYNKSGEVAKLGLEIV
jgi:DNA polymerase I